MPALSSAAGPSPCAFTDSAWKSYQPDRSAMLLNACAAFLKTSLLPATDLVVSFVVTVGQPPSSWQFLSRATPCSSDEKPKAGGPRQLVRNPDLQLRVAGWLTISQFSSMHRTRSPSFSCSTATWTLRTSMQIRDLDPEAPEAREVCAELLVEEFRDIAPDAWPTIEKARKTVDECLRSGPVRVAHVNGTIVGWIGGHHVFSRVWELHPLVGSAHRNVRGSGSVFRLLTRKREQERGLRGKRARPPRVRSGRVRPPGRRQLDVMRRTCSARAS